MSKIYLACPYSHKKEEVRLFRFQQANRAALYLMKKGNIVFSPISMSHPVAVQEELPLDWEFWGVFDESFIEWCELLMILKLDGWEKSVGISNERRIAKELNKEIDFMDAV